MKRGPAVLIDAPTRREAREQAKVALERAENARQMVLTRDPKLNAVVADTAALATLAVDLGRAVPASTVKHAAMDAATEALASRVAGLERAWSGVATTNASGEATFTLTGFTAPPVCVVSVERNTTAATQFPSAFIRTRTATAVVVKVVESKTSPVVAAGSAEGLEPAGAGITVHLFARAAT